MGLEHQVVIVTGASAGIGEATALELGRAGALVVLAARRQDRLDALKKEIEEAGGRALAVPADITAPAAREKLVQVTLETFGRIDALVNNAGFGQRGPIELVPIENIRQNFETNLFALIALTQLVIPGMRRQGSGRILNIGSVAGKIARPFSSVYDATKHALEAISDGLRGELAPFGIQVVVIEPGFIHTEFLEVANRISSSLDQSTGSPYGKLLVNFDNYHRRAIKYGARPEEIAAVVVKALTAARPKTRYAAPFHARFFLAMRWLVSDRFLDRLVKRQMGFR